MNTNKNVDNSQKIEELKKGARSGSASHQLELAKILLHRSTGNTSSNYIEAVKLLELSAKQNSVVAQTMLADELAKNPDTYDSSLYWFKKAAFEKSNYALKRLGELLYYNSKSDNEIVEGLKYLRKSANLGNTDASYQLGIIYLSPKVDDVMADEDEAIHFLTISANALNIDAMKTLGLIYGSGNGKIEKDMLLSKKYFEMAIENGSIDSYHDLSVLYFKEAFIILNKGAVNENKNNSQDDNDKITSSTNLKHMLKNLGVEF